MIILFIYYTDILVGTLVLYVLDRRETVLRELGKNPYIYLYSSTSNPYSYKY
jgi:hypothetical protein